MKFKSHYGYKVSEIKFDEDNHAYVEVKFKKWLINLLYVKAYIRLLWEGIFRK